jgi:hypothetical protein
MTWRLLDWPGWPRMTRPPWRRPARSGWGHPEAGLVVGGRAAGLLARVGGHDRAARPPGNAALTMMSAIVAERPEPR